MTQDLIHYPQLIDQAMRGMVREMLTRVAASGLPGGHHFYISFGTTHPGVRISEQLKARYSKDITIVLQHQFWDFRVEDQQFHVTLSFNGVPEKLTIPFAAMTAFADPSVRFGLQFQPTGVAEIQVSGVLPDAELPPVSSGPSADPASAEVISLDAFRKK